MPLERRQVAVNFAAGLDTKSDPKQVQGKVLALENGVFTSPGRLKKRTGYKKVASQLADTRMVTQYGDELLAANGTTLYSYSAATASWDSQGACWSVGVSRDTAWRSSGATHPQSVSLSGLTLTVYQRTTPGSGVGYCVRDDATGQDIVTDVTAAASGVLPKVAALNGRFVVFWLEATGGFTATMKFATITTASPGVVGSASTIATSVDARSAFDVVLGLGGQNVYVAWSTSTQIKAAYVDSTFAASSSVVIATGASGAPYARAIGIFADELTEYPIIAWAEAGGDVQYAGCNGTLAVSYSASIETPIDPATASDAAYVTHITGHASNGVGYIYYSAYNDASAMWTNGPSGCWIRKCAFVQSTPGAKSTFMRGVQQWSRIQLFGTIRLFLVVHPYGYYTSGGVPRAVTNAMYFAVTDSGDIIARVGQQDAYAVAPEVSTNSLCDWIVVSSGVYRAPINVISRTLTAASVTVNTNAADVLQVPGVDLITIDTANATNRYQTAVLGGVLNINGGLLQQYDGASVVEQGFHYPPMGCHAAAASGSGLTAGQYQYKVVYEWTDAQGNVHLSAPSPAATVAVSGGNLAATVTVPTLPNTAKANVAIRIYRTLVDGSVFYLVNGPFSGQQLANDKTKDTLTFSDTTTDTALQSSLLLYTASEVDNIAGPPANAMTVYRNRLMLVNSESPEEVWYSKQTIPGTPVAFNDTFIVNIDPTDGPVTAMGWLDDKIAVFKRNIIFYFTGTGPAPDGTANDFSTPIVINTNSGCVAPKSVVTADDGVMYQSAKGIYLLTRGLEDAYIGAGVEAYNAASAVSAQMIPNTNEVRFAMSSGVVLVWDYFLKQWSTFTFSGSPAITAAAIYQNVYAYASSGQVWQENPGTYKDDTATYALKVKTAWIQLAGLQGYQRAYKALVLGDYASAHTLTAKVYVDFDDGTAVQTSTITPTSTKPYQYRIFLARQKCEALQFELYDSSPTGTAEAFDISALSLEIGVKRGLRKMEAARSV